ncbi:hypothetical protein NEUTE1DRAFT_117028 [Neurospora tetrasperma FGSC 2508]|uniref:Uncharacterized protein n=1 Tax=Neurospora tetrasperma (strain FGSC 2508 / ATCC MYA-4615 / P0657) TaxID=510951 RepID=F8MN00_NEUT8|nr:uncharacterized protein NEUTE1DRAFT_117028 [Neurospora tetrasperma FGSC 2508]EGO58024.1 hypothetical protein NEUTE1DRAFT_117028 [Neurospora tetrasperma FGSC 2508]EGZ71670.1 hypothetical protein NEUTE2DRAFT_144580 [Neurospora tetrasperma FGSC 2509]
MIEADDGRGSNNIDNDHNNYHQKDIKTGTIGSMGSAEHLPTLAFAKEKPSL